MTTDTRNDPHLRSRAAARGSARRATHREGQTTPACRNSARAVELLPKGLGKDDPGYASPIGNAPTAACLRLLSLRRASKSALRVPVAPCRLASKGMESCVNGDCCAECRSAAATQLRQKDGALGKPSRTIGVQHPVRHLVTNYPT